MSETREPGYYWVRRKSGVPWEIVLVHPYDERYDKKSGQAVDSMGWDAGACLPSDAEWGSRILSPGEASRQQRELDAARKVIDIVRDRPAVPNSNIPSGGERVRLLVRALDAWMEACGGPEAAEQALKETR